MAHPVPTLDEVKAELRRIDPSLTDDHRCFKTALFLVAAKLGVGQSDVALHRFTGFSRGWLIRRIKNLKKAGIWREGTDTHRWYDEGFGAVELRLDVRAAEGEVDEDLDGRDTARARSTLAEITDDAGASTPS
jgi:hypothetical protein